MAKTKIGWGLIGATSWAKNMFGPAITQAGNAELRAILSSDHAKAEKLCGRLGVAGAYSNLDQLLADDSVEAVWIASPNHLHAPQAIACLNAGKHVLCEKPMAVTSAECSEMIRVAEKQGRLLSIGYHMRQHPSHQAVHGEFVKGTLGKPVFVRAHLYFAYPNPPGEWRQKKATSGGWALCDVGTHLVDLLRWFLGEAASVHGELSSLRFGYETDDHAVVSVRFQNGGLGIADASTGAGGAGPRLEVYGTEGFCVFEGTFFGDAGVMIRGERGKTPERAETPAAPLYKLQAENFGNAIMGKESLRVTAEDGYDNIRILEKARGW